MTALTAPPCTALLLDAHLTRPTGCSTEQAARWPSEDDHGLKASELRCFPRWTPSELATDVEQTSDRAVLAGHGHDEAGRCSAGIQEMPAWSSS